MHTSLKELIPLNSKAMLPQALNALIHGYPVPLLAGAYSKETHRRSKPHLRWIRGQDLHKQQEEQATIEVD